MATKKATDSVEPVADEPVETTEPAVATATDNQQVVYVTAPQPPRKKGNRLIGSLIAIVAAAVYGLVLAGVFVLLSAAIAPAGTSVNIFGSAAFYFPIALFLVGLIIVVLVTNRAGWWAHLIGSIVVGLIVYFGTVGLLLLLNGVVAKSPTEASHLFQVGLLNPLVVAAALLAREVAIWTGAIISWRGKRVKVRNLTAREEFDREQAELAAK